MRKEEVNMKKVLIPVICVLMACAMLLGMMLTLGGYEIESNPRNHGYGSFSPERTESFDGKYYALQTVVDRMIEVTVYATDGNRRIFSFQPARSMDFWGICWENDSYNIWIQSADIGIYCYEFVNEVWTVKVDAVRPSYIVSRWDEKEE